MNMFLLADFAQEAAEKGYFAPREVAWWTGIAGAVGLIIPYIPTIIGVITAIITGKPIPTPTPTPTPAPTPTPSPLDPTIVNILALIDQFFPGVIPANLREVLTVAGATLGDILTGDYTPQEIALKIQGAMTAIIALYQAKEATDAAIAAAKGKGK